MLSYSDIGIMEREERGGTSESNWCGREGRKMISNSSRRSNYLDEFRAGFVAIDRLRDKVKNIYLHAEMHYTRLGPVAAPCLPFSSPSLPFFCFVSFRREGRFRWSNWNLSLDIWIPNPITSGFVNLSKVEQRRNYLLIRFSNEFSKEDWISLKLEKYSSWENHQVHLISKTYVCYFCMWNSLNNISPSIISLIKLRCDKFNFWFGL